MPKFSVLALAAGCQYESGFFQISNQLPDLRGTRGRYLCFSESASLKGRTKSVWICTEQGAASPESRVREGRSAHPWLVQLGGVMGQLE